MQTPLERVIQYLWDSMIDVESQELSDWYERAWYFLSTLDESF